jgi:hypothetical protein
MITVALQSHLVNVAVLGQFILADFRELEDAVTYKIKFEGKVNLLIDLRDMTGLTLDVAWEDIKFTRQHRLDLGKIAVVTESRWIAWSTWLTGLFGGGDIRVFDDYTLASEWTCVA